MYPRLQENKLSIKTDWLITTCRSRIIVFSLFAILVCRFLKSYLYLIAITVWNRVKTQSLMNFSVGFFVFLQGALLVLGCLSAQAKMIRWVDANGEVHYADQVPPEQSKFRRETLNKQGFVVGITEAAKTKEQRALERKLRKLRKKMEKIVAQKKSRDQVLLASFRSVEDIRQRLSEKLWALTTLQNIAQGNLKRLKKQLSAQYKNAARYEREGKAVPKNMLKEIESTEKQIHAAQLEMGKLIEKKQIERRNLESDIDRFIFLTQPRDGEYISADDQPELITAEDIGLFTCKSENQCDVAWEFAHEYVVKNSTTDLDIAAENLIMSYAPAKDTDLSLSIAKLRSDDVATKIFLDIRCRKSLHGDQLCASELARQIRSSFYSFIESSLASDQKRTNALVSK